MITALDELKFIEFVKWLQQRYSLVYSKNTNSAALFFEDATAEELVQKYAKENE